jgi:hypothetical protein
MKNLAVLDDPDQSFLRRHARVFPQKIFKQIVARSVRMDSGWNWDALHVILLVANAHDFTVVGPGRHIQAIGQRFSFNDQGMISSSPSEDWAIRGTRRIR